MANTRATYTHCFGSRSEGSIVRFLITNCDKNNVTKNAKKLLLLNSVMLSSQCEVSALSEHGINITNPLLSVLCDCGTSSEMESQSDRIHLHLTHAKGYHCKKVLWMGNPAGTLRDNMLYTEGHMLIGLYWERHRLRVSTDLLMLPGQMPDVECRQTGGDYLSSV